MSFIKILLALLVSASAYSETVSVQDVIRETQSDSLQIQKAEAAYHEVRWKKTETYAGFLPSLTGELSYITEQHYMFVTMPFGASEVTVPQIMPSTLYTLKAAWPIFDGFASTNRYLAGSSYEESAKNAYEWTQFATTRQAILQFYNVLAADVLKEVAQQNLKTLTDHLKDIRAYRRAGVSTQYDVLRVEVQVSEAQTEILNAQDNLDLSLMKLAETLGHQNETRKPIGELPVLDAHLIQNLNKDVVDSRQDLQALKEKSQGAQYMESSANRYWAPHINLFGQYQKYNNRNYRFDDESSFRDAYQVGVNLTWNLFDGMASTSRSGQAEQQAIQIDKEYRLAQIKAQNDFELWRRKYLYYCSVYQSRVQDVSRSEEAVRLARVGRRAGTRTNTELLDAETDLFRSKAGRVKAQIGAIEALINLELSSGKKLYDFN